MRGLWWSCSSAFQLQEPLLAPCIAWQLWAVNGCLQDRTISNTAQVAWLESMQCNGWGTAPIDTIMSYEVSGTSWMPCWSSSCWRMQCVPLRVSSCLASMMEVLWDSTGSSDWHELREWLACDWANKLGMVNGGLSIFPWGKSQK